MRTSYLLCDFTIVLEFSFSYGCVRNFVYASAEINK